MSAAAATPYQAGLQAFQVGDLAGARAQFQRAAQADSRAFQAHYSLGVVEERLGRNAAALAAYRAALGAMQNYEPALTAYAMLLAQTGKVSEAETFLNERRARLPDSAGVLAALAEVKSIQGNSGAAQELAQQALKKNPDYRPAMMTLARDHYRKRRLDLALYTLTAILDGYGPENPARDKNNAAAMLLRGLIYKEQGRRRDAFSQFKRAVELRPDLVEARLNLAKYMLEAGNAAEAAPMLEGALRYDAGNVFAHLDLGDAYRLLGRPNEAKQHLDWVLAKDSSLAQAHYNLGLLYLFSQSVPGLRPTEAMDKAISHFERYKEMRSRTAPGAGDDADELIQRTKNKKAILQATAQQPAAQQPSAPPPSAARQQPSAPPPNAARPPATPPTRAAPPAAAPPASRPPATAPPASPPAGAPSQSPSKGSFPQ
jgi:tetratricopeptide (TPR) repeat protein